MSWPTAGLKSIFDRGVIAPGARADIGHYAPGPVLHSIAYALLATLWFIGSRGSALARACKAVLAVAMMGACDEFVQSFFPYRGASVRDWAVDVKR